MDFGLLLIGRQSGTSVLSLQRGDTRSTKQTRITFDTQVKTAQKNEISVKLTFIFKPILITEYNDAVKEVQFRFPNNK